MSTAALALTPLAAKVTKALEEAAKQTGGAKRITVHVDNAEGECRMSFGLREMVEAIGKSSSGTTEGVKLDIHGPVTVDIPGVGDVDFMLEGNGLWLKCRVCLPVNGNVE